MLDYRPVGEQNIIMEQGFNKFAAGAKVYPRGAPNVGKTKTPGAYKKRSVVAGLKAKIPTQSNNAFRDNKSVMLRSALLRKMKARQTNKTSIGANAPARNLFSGPGGF